MENKIRELEESVEKSAKKLSWVFDIFNLAVEEMQKSFSWIFWVESKKKDNFITLELEQFEKEWMKNLYP